MTEPKHQSRDPGILSTLATTTKQTITKFERAAKSSTELLKPAESAMETAVQARSSSIAVDGFHARRRVVILPSIVAGLLCHPGETFLNQLAFPFKPEKVSDLFCARLAATWP